MSAKNRNFKNILINPEYQIKYVFWVTTAGLSLIAANAFIVYHYIKENYKLLVELSPMDEASKAQLYQELNEILVKLGIVGFIFVVLTAIIGIRMSHRTAGPLYHFKRVFNEIKSGNTNARVRLRPKDDFKDVAESFNEMMDSISKKN